MRISICLFFFCQVLSYHFSVVVSYIIWNGFFWQLSKQMFVTFILFFFCFPLYFDRLWRWNSVHWDFKFTKYIFFSLSSLTWTNRIKKKFWQNDIRFYFCFAKLIENFYPFPMMMMIMMMMVFFCYSFHIQ